MSGHRNKDATWRVIPGFSSYMVSDEGEIVGCRPAGKRSHPEHAFGDFHWMRPYVSRTGYRCMLLADDDGVLRPIRIARMVLLSFVGHPPKGFQAAHNNGVSSDDRLSNLRWASAVENNNDRRIHGTMPCGERSGTSKITESMALAIIQALSGGKPVKRLARELGVTRDLVDHIKKGRTWRHLPRPPMPKIKPGRPSNVSNAA